MIEVTPDARESLVKGRSTGQVSESDSQTLGRALALAEQGHGDRVRSLGDTYVEHARAVAAGLNELGIDDTDTIAAALLHDILLPHTGVTEAQLEAEFGETVAGLVRSASVLVDYAQRVGEKRFAHELSVDATQDRATLEVIRRALLSITEGDVRVILLRMVDCLQDLRRTPPRNEDEQRRIAFDALHIYAPIANRLGVWHIKWQLEDLAFRLLGPDKYRDIARHLDDDRGIRAAKLNRAAARLRRRLASMGLKATVAGRPKHIYSIYRKMVLKQLTFDQIHDVQALRVILEPLDWEAYKLLSNKARIDFDKALCYQALGAVHNLWKPIRGEFDDYVGSPKANGYMSLHTAVIDAESGQKLEVQIRTQRMHEEAEHGIAAHWAYKEQRSKVTPSAQKRIQNLRDLLATLQEAEDDPDSAPLLDLSKLEERVHVFTPNDDVVDLPAGSTPIDFAYQIHSALGNRLRSARVNGRIVPLDYKLQSGDKVEIIAPKPDALVRGGPKRDWLSPTLGYTGSARTRSKIRQWFRQQDRGQNIQQGREVVERELRQLMLHETYTVEDIAAEFKTLSLEDFLAKVGFGDILPPRIVSAIVARQREDRPKQVHPVDDLADLRPLVRPPSAKGAGLTVHGVGGLHTRFARCCTPIPPQEIVGYITRGQGVTIHARDCKQVAAITERERLIDVAWGSEKDKYHIPIVIHAVPTSSLIEDIMNILRSQKIDVPKTKMVTEDGWAILSLVVEVTGLAQLTNLLNRLNRLPYVREAYRQRWK